MLRRIFVLILGLGLSGVVVAQVQTLPSSEKGPGETQAPPRSDRDREAEAGESSSRDTRIDIRPPKDDAKNHPFSGAALEDATGEPGGDAEGDVQEFHPWDPHKAAKDIEVGDFYFKRRNYRAALERYKEALLYKNNDAMANYRMAQCLEKLNQPEEARVHYEEYLKILPHGEYSAESQKKLGQLKEDGDKK